MSLLRAPQRSLLCLLLLPSFGFDWPGKVYRIEHALEHADPDQRRELLRELALYPASSVKEPLLSALEDADPEVRLAAAAVAGRVRLREALPILLDWLDDKEAETRKAAASALGCIGEARALPGLTRALGDTTGEVRRAAVIALGQLGAAEAVVPLLGRLEDVDLGVRLEAIGTLGKLGDARAVAPLLSATADPAPEVRVATLAALGEIRDARALAALARALSDDAEEARLAAASALGRLRDKNAVRPLKAALEHAETRFAQALVAALGCIDDSAARDLLISKLAVAALRQTATHALVEQARALERDAATAASAPAATAASTESSQRGAGPLVAALASALRAADPAAKLALARALLEVARVASIDVSVDALLGALPGADPELSSVVLGALGASGSSLALMPLLEHLAGGSDAGTKRAALDALQTYFERAEPDGRAADPLLARLAEVQGAERLEVVRILGQTGAERALPALAPLLQQRKDIALRLEAVRAVGSIGAPAGGALLLPLLEADDDKTRFETALALRRTADADTVKVLLSRLVDLRAADRHALLLALGGALARLSTRRALPEPIAASALQAFTAVLGEDDDELSARALDALAVWAPQGALSIIAKSLSLPSSRRRAEVVAALGQLQDKEARTLLRYLLQHGSAREIATAAAALGELGDQRDASALLKAAQRQHWPVPGAAAYALARIAARGALKPHLASRELCELGRSREPYVRANVAAGLAALGRGPCEEAGPDPLRWLGPEHAEIVRAAAARWAHAALRAGKIDPARAGLVLERCASSDLDPDVRAACEGEPQRKADAQPADVYAHASDGMTLLRNALVGLRLADGSAFIGYSDRNGHLRLRAAPQGDLRLEDPSLFALEPAEPERTEAQSAPAKE